MTGRRKWILIALPLLLAILALLWLVMQAREKQKPVSNALFVMRHVEEGHMATVSRVEIPVNDANGNAGTHRPEKEIFYQEGRPDMQKNHARTCL